MLGCWGRVGVWGCRCWGTGVSRCYWGVVEVLGCCRDGVSGCWGLRTLLGCRGVVGGLRVLLGCRGVVRVLLGGHCVGVCWAVGVSGCGGICRGGVGVLGRGAVVGHCGAVVGRCGAAVGRCRPPPYQVQAGALQYVHQLLEPRPRREDEVVVHPQDVFGAHLGDGQVPPREPALCHGSAPQPGRTTRPRPIQPPPHTAPAPHHSPRPIEPPPHRAPAPYSPRPTSQPPPHTAPAP